LCPTITPMQRRQLLHTTAMQDQKYRACTQAMGRVQGDLSHMHSRASGNSSSGNASSGASADPQQQGDDPTSDLSSDLQDMAQSDDDLISSLNDDQQAVVTNQIKDLEKKTKEMQALAQQLKSELDSPKSDPKVVREDMKKLDKLTKETTKRQHDVAVALGIQA
jgi:hypothetical protein